MVPLTPRPHAVRPLSAPTYCVSLNLAIELPML